MGGTQTAQRGGSGGVHKQHRGGVVGGTQAV